MKIGVDIGHQVKCDRGAVGIVVEDDVNLAVGIKVITKLKNKGHKVINCTPTVVTDLSDALFQRSKKANDNGCDLFISIHHNKYNTKGYGCEVFVNGFEMSSIYGERVCNNLKTLGFNNRGVKDGRKLFVLRNSSMPAVLVECCFIDNVKDMELWNAEKISDCIVNAVEGITIKKEYSPNSKESIRELQQALSQLDITDKDNKPLVVDGIYGELTRGAVKKFQEIVGLEIDGVYSAKVTTAIYSITNKRLCWCKSYDKIPTRYIQWRTDTYIDGIYGENTKWSVKQFQCENYLTSDGIVGMATWNKLLGEM